VARLILQHAKLDPSVLDAAVLEGAQYRGSMQLVADDLLVDSRTWERFDFGQFTNAERMFRGMPRPQVASAFVITKPPETVVILWLPPRFLDNDSRNSDQPLWVFVDSHPRRELGYGAAYARIFQSFDTMRDELLRQQPFISMELEDAWLYDVCEFIGIRLGTTAQK
jgi:hypothetical protein